MPFLTLNELTIPLSTKGGTETLTPLGASGRTLDATLRDNAEDTKRIYNFRTTPQVQVNAEALKRPTRQTQWANTPIRAWAGNRS